MSLSNAEIHEIAAAAVKAMHKEKGAKFTFPIDLIWDYVDKNTHIPSLKKPHQGRALIKDRLIALTGGMTRAVSASRAGSPTREYRFGDTLIGSTPSGSGHTAPNSHTGKMIGHLQVAMESKGYLISAAELANFFLAMTTSPMVVLTGISGTGKSLLPRHFANLTGSRFHAIPVQPQWSDNSDLMGYVPTLSPAQYTRGALIGAILDATQHPDTLVIALLDEMNLAPVEHYLSDILSVAETRTRMGSNISTDKLPIELPQQPEDATDQYAALRDLELPANLRLVGTANMDETTHTFSAKVLDRAFTIEFDTPDLTAFPSPDASATTVEASLGKLAESVVKTSNPLTILEARDRSQDLFESTAAILSDIQDILAPSGIHFGFRTRDAILMYLHYWQEHNLEGVLSGYAALDFCISQKILPKISGSGETLGETLRSLAAWLTERSSTTTTSEASAPFAGPLTRSLQKVEHMIAILDEDGATRYWGA